MPFQNENGYHLALTRKASMIGQEVANSETSDDVRRLADAVRILAMAVNALADVQRAAPSIAVLPTAKDNEKPIARIYRYLREIAPRGATTGELNRELFGRHMSAVTIEAGCLVPMMQDGLVERTAGYRRTRTVWLWRVAQTRPAVPAVDPTACFSVGTWQEGADNDSNE
jgi:hypothetical protein